MFYTKFAKIISVIMLFIGITQIILGFVVINSEDPKLAAARYLGSHTSGEAIDKGFLYIFIAISLGVLAEISTNLYQKVQNKSKSNEKVDK